LDFVLIKTFNKVAFLDDRYWRFLGKMTVKKKLWINKSFVSYVFCNVSESNKTKELMELNCQLM